MSDIRELTEAMRWFSEERDWIRFHDPKSLTLALVGEPVVMPKATVEAIFERARRSTTWAA